MPTTPTPDDHPLRVYRLRFGLSLNGLAQLLDVQSSTVLRIENGDTKPSYDLILRIAAVTRGTVTPNKLFDWTARAERSGLLAERAARRAAGREPASAAESAEREVAAAEA